MEIDQINQNPNETHDGIRLRNGNTLEINVYYGRENATQIKRLRTRKIIENNNDVGLYEELRQIDHENIVKMVGSRIQDNYRLTEFVYEEFTLDYIIHETDFLRQKDIMIGEFVLQIAQAVSFLHNKLIFHSYINCKTIYVKDGITIKLGGLYFCEKLEQPNSTIDITVNTNRHLYYDYWTAGVNLIGLDYDIWCIGLVLYEMLFGEQPPSRFDVEVLYDDLSNNYGYSRTLVRAFRRMLRPRPITYDIAALLLDFEGYRIGRNNRHQIIERIRNRGTINNGQREYTLVNLLGIGTFGHAIRVIDEDAQDIKVIKLINPQNHDGVDAFRETIINRLIAGLNPEDETIRNIHVVGFYDYFLESGSLCLVTEYCHGRDLDSFISKSRQDGSQIPVDILKDFIYQLIVGIRFIHEQSVIHRDIKPSNILLHRVRKSDKFFLKYCDFGLSRKTDEIGGPFKTLVGTPRYAAPEIHRGSTQLNNSIDIWSLGCVIYELITQEYLFPNPDRIISKISDSNWSLPINNYNEEFYNLLSMMLQINPGDRATSQVLFGRVRNWKLNQ